MYMTGLARLGRDIEVRHTTDGTPVGGLALAFNWGKKNAEGARPTQWVDASLWGERATKLAEYLTKGTQVSVILSEPHVETFERRDGTQGTKLVAKVLELQFAGGPRDAAQQPPRPAAPAPRPAPAASSSSDNFGDDDIPF